jgi:hypothetical protein
LSLSEVDQLTPSLLLGNYSKVSLVTLVLEVLVPERGRATASLVPGCSWITGKPHLTLVGVGCCSRARVCLDRRSETQMFVDPGAFLGTDPIVRSEAELGWRIGQLAKSGQFLYVHHKLQMGRGSSRGQSRS